MNKTNDLDNFDIDELLETEKLLNEEDGLSTEELAKKKSDRAFAKKLNQGENIQEAVRDLVFDDVKASFDAAQLMETESQSEVDVEQVVKDKRVEIYEIMENLDKELEGKSVKEVTALFSSLLNIQSQLCMQKTEGVITVRTRLYNFFSPKTASANVKKTLRQEISLMFSPEEVKAIRVRVLEMQENDPLKPFLTTVLDQAYDVIQYSEMTGNLLLEITKYFLMKLERNGYGDTPKALDYKERHNRAKLSLDNAINDLRDVEIMINDHLYDRPVLIEFPKLLRVLIQIKLGVIDQGKLPKILSLIKEQVGQYSRARSAVAFDFNRLPSYQHGVRLRQSIILNLHKDILNYTGELFEKEFNAVKDEFESLMKDIETASEDVQPGTPEYDELMAKKARLQKKLEQHRRKLDVVKSQEKMIDVQHQMVGDAIKRYNANEALQQKVEAEMQSSPKVDPDKVRSVEAPAKRKISRMARARGRGN